MRITLVAIGKCRDKGVLSLCAEYQKRLKAFWPTEVVELADKSGNMDAEKTLIEKYLTKQKESLVIVALDERGKGHSSQSFSTLLQKQEEQGISHMVFVIGGADGLHPDIKNQATFNLSLSSFTLPHMLVRPIILEQIYRAATIASGHPYHRD